jgi:ribosomal protein S12 methylthiotransferase
MRFRIVSLGCPKNLVESEYIVSRLRSAGHTISDDGETIVINTCAFIAEAARESIETVLEAAREPGRRVVVTGCLVERYREELAELLPEVDAFVGRSRYGEIERVIGKSGLYVGEGGFSETFPRQVLTKPPTAYLKIQEGCDNRCHYCTIPVIRGGLASRDEKDVIGEFRWLVDQGYREINVIGQDITSYGKDAGREQGLTGLVSSLLKERGDWHVRLLYMHPKGITGELIDLMGSDARVIPYLDVPIQHSEDRILSLMGRGHTKSYLEGMLDMMRRRLPGAVLRTSIIVGFPTETEEEFGALLSFVCRHQFDMLGAFMYSREEGTVAYRMKGQIRKGVKRDRYLSLMETQKEISRARLADLLGKTVKVIVEDAGASPKVGRMLTQAPDIDGIAFVNGACAEGEIREGKVVKTLDYDVVVEV